MKTIELTREEISILCGVLHDTPTKNLKEAARLIAILNKLVESLGNEKEGG